MDDFYAYVGDRIRKCREAYGGKGITQEALAQKLDVATNTVSRWETGTYRPAIDELEALARFLGVSILELLPPEDAPEPTGSAKPALAPLLRAAQDLPQEDLVELTRYAEFRRARSRVEAEPRRKRGRPKTKVP